MVFFLRIVADYCLALASRLTENKNMTVAVVEAGPNANDEFIVYAPGMYSQAVSTDRCPLRLTVPQENMDNGTLSIATAKMLGGGTAVDGLVWTRNALKDFDAWEELGNPGWNGEVIFNYFKKTIQRFDFNAGCIASYVSRENLVVMANSTVARIEFAAQNGSEPLTATSIQYYPTSGDRSQIQTLIARREVTASAGAIGSPKFLEVSGIGSKDIVTAAGVQSLIDLPDVSSNIIRNSTEQWAEYYSSTNSINPDLLRAQCNIVASRYEEDYLSPIEINYTPGYGGVGSVNKASHNRGYTHTNSSDIEDPSNINPQYYSNSMDIDVHVASTKLARKIINVPKGLGMLNAGETEPGNGVATDDQVRDWLLNNVRSDWHPVGTCAMLPKELGGVVDPNLKVYGTANLRVVDASIMPLEISSHSMQPTYDIAEKAADMINSEQ
ncbi:MAG: hypothetical protein EXX96DRAFT_540734 [Benjaminiella poitrasii]|nr:MAG: hypothetical protein EXX96DRAFT_540734 [Benjaminiella poitrasii]